MQVMSFIGDYPKQIKYSFENVMNLLCFLDKNYIKKKHGYRLISMG